MGCYLIQKYDVHHNSVSFEKKTGKSKILKYLITFYHLLPVKGFYRWLNQLTAGPVKSKNIQPYSRSPPGCRHEACRRRILDNEAPNIIKSSSRFCPERILVFTSGGN